MMEKRPLMAVGAHADDIELNAGGTLSKYHAAGYDVVYVMSTNNFSGEWQRINAAGKIETTKPPYTVITPQRKLEAAAAAELFGTTPIHLDHPQRHYTRADGTTAELRYGCELPEGLEADIPTIITACEHEPSIKQLADLIAGKNPEAVITHSPMAENPEHFATSLLVTRAYRQAKQNGYEGWLLQWPDLGVTVFGKLNCHWDTFIDVSDYWEDKIKACGKHACQLPRPERLDFPDWGPACGCRGAEAFLLIEGQPGSSSATGSFSLEIARNLR